MVMIAGAERNAGALYNININGEKIAVHSWGGGEVQGGGRISELTFVTYVTAEERAIPNIVNAIGGKGQDLRYTITIAELAKDKSVVKTHVYDDCLLTSMDFAPCDAGSGDLATRTTTWKPTRLTVT